jgi:methionyl-tRNA formyltransferase
MKETTSQAPGQVETVMKDAIQVATGQGVLAIKELQPANSRRMPVTEYLAGHSVQIGTRLSQSAGS